MDDLYREHILDHARSPRNFGEVSTGETWTHSGSALNASCGDTVSLSLDLNSDGKVQQVAWQGQGCAISMAAASMVSEMIIGSQLTDWQAIKPEAILVKLGLEGISGARHKCALTFWRALETLEKSENTSVQ